MTPARIVAELLEVEPDEIRPKDYLRQIPKREEEYWAFARSEAAHPETTHRHDELIANPTVTDYDEEGDWTPELGVIVYRDGTVTNRWSDGTAGVPANVVQAADELDELYSPYAGDMAFMWKRVYTNETGEFLGWAPENWER